MSDIQRWTVSQMNDHGLQLSGHDDGEWVLYADHVAAVAAARIEWEMSNGPAFDFARGQHVGYVAGAQDERKRSVLLIADAYGKGVQAARDAVAAECHHDDPNEWCIFTAAIDALMKEKP